jgi:hypothetical protein
MESSQNGRQKSFFKKIDFKKFLAFLLICFCLILVEILRHIFDLDLLFKKEMIINLMSNFRENTSVCLFEK